MCPSKIRVLGSGWSSKGCSYTLQHIEGWHLCWFLFFLFEFWKLLARVVTTHKILRDRLLDKDTYDTFGDLAGTFSLVFCGEIWKTMFFVKLQIWNNLETWREHFPRSQPRRRNLEQACSPSRLRQHLIDNFELLIEGGGGWFSQTILTTQTFNSHQQHLITSNCW